MPKRNRGERRRSLRSPFFLAVFAVLLGAVGFTQLGTPAQSVAFVVAPTHPPTLPARPSQAPSLPGAAAALSPNATASLAPTATASASPTQTSSPSPTLTNTAPPTRTSTPIAPAVTPITITLESTAVATSAPVPRSLRVPILMYHHVGDLPADADAIRKSLTVSQERFEQEMKYLSDEGFVTVRLADLADALRSGTPLPDKAIVLSFDDGYADNYVNVFPTLKDYGFTGTFFVISGRADFPSPDYMTWDQILELASNGMEIGSHSATHRYNLGSTYAATQRAEIVPPDARFQDKIPNWVRIFSYPSGSYNQYTLDLLQQLGYVAAVTTRQGTLQDSAAPLELRRVRIRGEWTFDQFVYWFHYFDAAR